MSGSATFSWTLPPGPPLTEAQRALVVEALPLATPVVRHYLKHWPIARQYQDELQSVAYEGIIRAAQHWRSGRNSWLSFAYGGAYMHCRAWLQAMGVRAMESIDAPLNGDSDTTWLERRAASTGSPEELVLQRQVLALAEQLPERQRAALLRHLDERHLEEIGQDFGVSRAAAHLWEKSGLRLLRERLGIEVERTRKKAAPTDGRDRLRLLLADGVPRTMGDLVSATGYTRPGLRTALRALGAVQVDVTTRRGQTTPLWALPRKAA